ncbi:peptide chain release factor-like protein, partial [Candidatus Hakubella thermalkaliphila]
DERSQLQNKDRALRILRARLYALYQRQQQEEITSARRSQVGTGARSEKLRTYNFPQDRVTDHRVGLTLHKLDSVLEGEIDEFVTNLAAAEQT